MLISSGVPKEPNPDAVESINPNNPLISKIKKVIKLSYLVCVIIAIKN